MAVETGVPGPRVLTESEQRAVEEQLERLLSNRHFSHSRRFPAFLRFVVDRTLRGNVDQLKERTLGVEIFGRSADYDTSSDPIVRVTAGEIRKRIAQYYQEPDHEGELRISLDAGSYVPQFHWPRERTSEGGAEAVRALPGESGGHGVAGAERATASDGPEAMLRDGMGAAVVPTGGRTRRWGVVVAVGLLVAVAAAGLGFRMAGAEPSSVEFFWGPVLHSNDPALLCLVSQVDTSNLAVDAQDPSQQRVVSTSMNEVNLDDLAAIVRVGNVLLSHGKKYTMKGSKETTLSDLRNGPTIFVGAFDNEWTMRLTRPLRFHFGNDEEFKHEWIADAKSSKAPEWFTNRPVQENANNYREYALVARFVDPDTGQLAVIAAGIGQGSTEAAGEFLTDPTQLAELARVLGPDGAKKNIEAVISTQIIDGQPGTAKIESTYTW
jgi:hypothetical protein